MTILDNTDYFDGCQCAGCKTILTNDHYRYPIAGDFLCHDCYQLENGDIEAVL